MSVSNIPIFISILIDQRAYEKVFKLISDYGNRA